MNENILKYHISDDYLSRRENWNVFYQKRDRAWKGTPYNIENVKDTSCILELGCGDGKTTRAEGLRHCSVVALDFAQTALLRCRSLKSICQDIHYVTGDAMSLPFNDETFDGVIAFHCLSHMTEPERKIVIDEIYRVLVQEGIFLLRDFSRNDMRYGKGQMIEFGTFLNKNGIQTHFFTEEEIRASVSRFSIERIINRESILRIRGEDFQRSDIEVASKKK